MKKFKIGDVVKPLPCEDGYPHQYLIAGKNYTVEGYTYDGKVNVSGDFRDIGDGLVWDEDWFELVEGDENVGQIHGITVEKDTSAETIRDKILRIREKRNNLKIEITALDKEEAELVEKLKQQGFVLYEQNEPETLVTEEKSVLYAEDIEEDMADPKNWKVGDVIESIDPYVATVGSLAKITDIKDGIIYRSGGEGFKAGKFTAMSEGIWKFHSRPN